MNKREATKTLKATRAIMAQADYAALTGDIHTYYAEAKRLRALGVVNAGHFGVSCPKCYREIAMGSSERTHCKCGTTADYHDAAAALGFRELNYRLGERRAV